MKARFSSHWLLLFMQLDWRTSNWSKVLLFLVLGPLDCCVQQFQKLWERAKSSVDINEARLEFAHKFAATGSFQPVRGDSAEVIARKLGELHDLEKGADAVLEA